MATHYQILGVPADASTSAIKQRFQQLIIQHHPDKKGSSSPTSNEDEAHKILQAWNILRDTEKRKQYDTQLEVEAHKTKVTINADVDLDDMEYEEVGRAYSMICRCSGTYVITEDDLEHGNDVICCDNCSLRIRVLYDVIEDDDDNI